MITTEDLRAHADAREHALIVARRQWSDRYRSSLSECETTCSRAWSRHEGECLSAMAEFDSAMRANDRSRVEYDAMYAQWVKENGGNQK